MSIRAPRTTYYGALPAAGPAQPVPPRRIAGPHVAGEDCFPTSRGSFLGTLRRQKPQLSSGSAARTARRQAERRAPRASQVAIDCQFRAAENVPPFRVKAAMDRRSLEGRDELVPRCPLQGLRGGVSGGTDDQSRSLELFQIVRLDDVHHIEAPECQIAVFPSDRRAFGLDFLCNCRGELFQLFGILNASGDKRLRITYVAM
jgi:hypothetical protein